MSNDDGLRAARVDVYTRKAIVEQGEMCHTPLLAIVTREDGEQLYIYHTSFVGLNLFARTLAPVDMSLNVGAGEDRAEIISAFNASGRAPH